MTWNELPAAVQDIARRELTRRQISAWILELAGYSTRRIARDLGLSHTNARDALAEAHRTLHQHGVRQHPNGDYYLKETNAA